MTPWGLVLVSALVSIVTGSGRSSRRVARAATPSTPYTQTSADYGRAHFQYLSTLARDEGLRRAWLQLATRYTPGLPYSAFIAAAASSEGGRLGGWYPPRGGWWVERARVAQYLREMGRTPAEYDTDSFLRGAAALRRLRESLDAVVSTARAMGVTVPTAARWSPWEYLLAVAGYSSGEGATARVLQRARAVLSAEPSSTRWTRAAEVIDGAARAAGGARGSVNGVRVAGIGGAASTLRRPRERYESGLYLTGHTTNRPGVIGGGFGLADAQWYDEPAWPPTEDRRLGAWTAGRDP